MHAKHNSGISLWGVDNDWNMFICGSLHSIDKFWQQSTYKRIFCAFGGTILEDWSRFVLITGGTKKGHFWMQRIAETVGEFLMGDWGRSRLITGGNIGGHYCTSIHNLYFAHRNNQPLFKKSIKTCSLNMHPYAHSNTHIQKMQYIKTKNISRLFYHASSPPCIGVITFSHCTLTKKHLYGFIVLSMRQWGLNQPCALEAFMRL